MPGCTIPCGQVGVDMQAPGGVCEKGGICDKVHGEDDSGLKVTTGGYKLKCNDQTDSVLPITPLYTNTATCDIYMCNAHKVYTYDYSC